MHELEDTAHGLGLPAAAVASVLPARFSAAYSRLQQHSPQPDDLFYCLDHLLRLFTGLSAGLASHLDPSRPELGALAAALDSPVQYERLLRFSVSLLRQNESEPVQQALLGVFFPSEEGAAPLHTLWLQLGSEAGPLAPLSRWPADGVVEGPQAAYLEVLDSWLRAALPVLQKSAWEVSRSLRSPQPLVRRWIYQGLAVALLPALAWELDTPGQAPGEAEWSPLWSRSQAENVALRLTTGSPVLPERAAPDFLHSLILQETGARASGYFLVEGPDGIGKSLALAGLQRSLRDQLPFLYFPVRTCFRGDFQTLIEEIDEGIQVRHDSQTTSMVGLGPLVIQELNRRYAPLSPAEKFQAYLSQLILRNGQRFMLVLDGLDEAFEGADSSVSLADYLGEVLPEGVFLLLSYRFEGCSARLARALTQLTERGAVTFDFLRDADQLRRWHRSVLHWSGVPDELAQRLLDAGNGLLQARLLGQGVVSEILAGPTLPSEEIWLQLLQQLERRWGEPFLRLLMVLATSYTPVPLEEISDLGFDPVMVEQLLEQIPALFLATPPTATSGWQLQLAHENLRLHLQEHYSHRYSQTCQRLAARAAHQLLNRPQWISADSEMLGSGGFRLDCLYRWLLDSQNIELTESVVLSQSLRQLRNRVCGFLEQRGRFHHKLSILQGLKSCLEILVTHHDTTELRDELAWAYNSRGLTYLHLGQFSQGLRELEFAEQQFRILVERAGQVHYRSGLASALNRRSEALRALGQVGEAWECAHQAVEQHRLNLQESGVLQPRLGLARALVQRARCAADHSLWPRALTDLQEALRLLEQSTRQAQARGETADVAAHFHEWIRALIVRAEAYRISDQNDDCLLDLDQALSLTQHLEEVHVVDWTNTKAPEIQVLQARAYEALQGLEEALEAYDEAIHGYGQQVRQGRLDLRQALAEAYHSRAELLRRRRVPEIDRAIEDYTRSLAFQAQLIECEEQSDLRSHRALSYQGRGDCLAGLGRRREALQDYDKAIEDYLFGMNSGRLQQSDFRRLALVYFQSGEIQLDLGEAGQAADRATSAIRILEERLGGGDEALARAHLLQAEGLSRLGDLETALASASKAIQVLSLRVRGDSGLLETHLADAHRLRADLSRRLGDENQALKDYGLAFHLYGGQHQEPDRLRQAEVLRCRAELQAERKEYDAAAEDLAAAFDLLSDNPQQAEAARLQLRRLRASLWRRQGVLSEALNELLVALEEQRQAAPAPESFQELLLELLSVQAELGQWAEFSILYSEFLRVRAEAGEVDVRERVFQLFEEIEGQSGDTDGGARADVLVALARLAAQLTPERGARLQARALYERGREKLLTHKVTEALEDFSEAIAQLRSDGAEEDALLIDLYSWRADGLLRAGLTDRARRDLDESTRLLHGRERPEGEDGVRLARLTIRKAVLLRQEGQFAQIVQDVGQVLALAGSNSLPVAELSWLHLARALAHDQLEQPRRAVADFREAAQLLSQLPESAETLQERLRCRLRLLDREEPPVGNFVAYCAEDALRCLVRLRVLAAPQAGQWVIPWVAQIRKMQPEAVPSGYLGDIVEELSHYLPGPLAPVHCQQLSQLLGQLASQAQEAAAAERLLGMALNLALLGQRRQSAQSLLSTLALLQDLYLGHPDHVPSLRLEPVFRSLQELSQASPPEGELGVRWNNVIRHWLSLSDHQLAACGVERSRLQALRLW